MQNFVMGFAFNPSENVVLLIEKNRPKWQAGYLNGIGGKIETKDQSPAHAMNREWKEEVGCSIAASQWERFLTFNCPGGTIYCFKHRIIVVKDFWQWIGKENDVGEIITAVSVDSIAQQKMMNNLLWIIPLALADLRYPVFVEQRNLSRGIIPGQPKNYSPILLEKNLKRNIHFL